MSYVQNQKKYLLSKHILHTRKLELSATFKVKQASIFVQMLLQGVVK